MGLLWTVLIGLEFCILRLKLGYPLFQQSHFQDEGDFALVLFDFGTSDLVLT